MVKVWDKCGTRSMVLSAKLLVYNVGGVPECLNAALLKPVRPERLSGVRIPPPPPASLRFSLCSPDCSENPNFCGLVAAMWVCALILQSASIFGNMETLQ